MSKRSPERKPTLSDDQRRAVYNRLRVLEQATDVLNERYDSRLVDNVDNSTNYKVVERPMTDTTIRSVQEQPRNSYQAHEEPASAISTGTYEVSNPITDKSNVAKVDETEDNRVAMLSARRREVQEALQEGANSHVKAA